jgi:hypothetical protein
MIRQHTSPLLALLVLVPLAGSAHHSDSSGGGQRVRLDGTVTAVQWISPHVLFEIRTEGARGEQTVWKAEAWSLPAFLRSGLTRDAFQPGQRVSVTGRIHVGRGGAKRLRLDSITRLRAPNSQPLR